MAYAIQRLHAALRLLLELIFPQRAMGDNLRADSWRHDAAFLWLAALEYAPFLCGGLFS